jgi:hypothetical protein
MRQALEASFGANSVESREREREQIQSWSNHGN